MNVINTVIAYFDQKGLNKQLSEGLISWSDEFIEFYLQRKDNEEYIIKAVSVELSNEILFLFYLPENPEKFLELMKILDRT
jgi:hypothetical protein